VFKDKLFAILETTRPYTLLWCGLVSLTGATIANNSFPDFIPALLITFIPIMGWIAGLCVSDFFDRNLDEIQKKHRPIPSGRIKSYEILLIGLIFALSGLILSFYLGFNNLIIALLAAILVISYAKFSKTRGIIGNINRGLITGTAFFFGVIAINKSITMIPSYIISTSLIFIIHDINSNLIGALRDIEGDKKGGYITFPVKYGEKKSIYISMLLTSLWFSLAFIIPFYYNFLNIVYYFILSISLIILLILYISLFSSLNEFNRKKSLKAHEFFVVERITLAAAFIFGISTLQNSIIIYILAVSITIILQYLLRGRYEFGKEL
jgi:4-hydroxybenzoate polyprenyltransferase/geranylgeranylglycerol-phosphate geranylgeranyltransferase